MRWISMRVRSGGKVSCDRVLARKQCTVKLARDKERERERQREREGEVGSY